MKNLVSNSTSAIAALALFAALAFGPASPSSAQQPASTESDDMNTTMRLALNNVNIDQLVKFLSDTTGKVVLKKKSVQAQVSITSPKPLTKRKALDLIYEALKMEGIYVVEFDSQIHIVDAESIKGLPITTLDPDVDLQSLPDSMNVAQRIYRLRNVSAETMKAHLEKFVPESALTIDAETNTMILTDQITRLKRYDAIIQALDRIDVSDRVTEIFRLKNADAIELATLLGNVMMETAATEGGMDPRQMQRMRMEMSRYSSRSNSGRYSSRNQGISSSVVAGDVTFVPDPRMNWLIVSCPSSQLEAIRKLVEEFDQEERQDVQTRIISIEHIDAISVASVIRELFRDSAGGAAKDVIRAVPSEEGNSLVVLASKANHQVILDLVKELDTVEAEMRETRTYKIVNLEVQALADQLQDLYDQRANRNNNPFGGFYFMSTSRNTPTKATFVSSPRTNSLIVLAKPRDFPSIEKMIEELDVPIDPASFQPHIYRIRHTDASVLVTVLETLFAGETSSRGGGNDIFWRPVGNDSMDSLDAMFGEIRFVVDTVTNTIVALASNPQDYKIIDEVVEKLDQMDPESTEVLSIQLKYADAIDIADRINNLFSEGTVQRSGQNNNQRNQQQQGDDGETAAQSAAAAVREVIYPWQSAQRTQGRGGEDEERPLNTMIGNVRCVPDLRSNKILLAAPPIYFPALLALVEGLDQEEPQVHITTRMVEILRGDDRRIGIRWTPDPNTIDPAELENSFVALTQLGFLDSFGANSSPLTSVISDTGFGGIGRSVASSTKAGNTILAADVNVALLVQLLLKNSKSKIISEPAMTINNNEQGSLFVGSEFPFRVNSQTTDRGSVTNGVEYRPVGITLDVTPHINTKGEVVLSIYLKNSQVRDELIDGQIIEDITRFETELAVASGQTMVIGGILLENESTIRRGTPFLSSIPVLKYFFSKKDQTFSKRELMVFITPEVLKSRGDDDALYERANERLDEMENDEPGGHWSGEGY